MVIAREQRRTRDAAIRLSTIDPLTGLFNRAFFFAALEREIARSARSGRGFCLLMMDLDELKAINDRLGHFHGDRVLRGVGEVDQRQRPADRHGGPLRRRRVRRPPARDRPDRRLRPGREDPARASHDMTVDLPGAGVHPSISVGVVSYPDDGRTADELMISADGAMYASKRGGKNRVTGVPMPADDRRRRRTARECAVAAARDRGPPAARCSIAPVSDDAERTDRAATAQDGPTPRDRAASRPGPSGPPHALPARRPAPDHVPIYQTATFTVGRRRGARRRRRRSAAGYAYCRIANPTVDGARRRLRRARRRRGRRRARLGDGRDPRRAGVACSRPGDRVVAPVAVYGSTRTPLLTTRSAGSASRSTSSTSTDLEAVAAALAAAPTRVLYAETIANPTTVVADHARARASSPTGTARLPRRQHVRLAVRLPAARARGRPRHRVGDEVPVGGHSDVIAGVVAGPRELIARVRDGPDRHGRDARPVRRLPRAARHPDAGRARGAPRPDGGGTGRAGSSVRTACVRVLYPGPAQPSAACRGRPPVPAGRGRRDARVRGRRRPGARAARVIDALTLPELTASLGSVHTMVVHPPSTSHRQLDRGRSSPRPASRPGLLRVLGRARGPRGPAGRLRGGARPPRAAAGSRPPAASRPPRPSAV